MCAVKRRAERDQRSPSVLLWKADGVCRPGLIKNSACPPWKQARVFKKKNAAFAMQKQRGSFTNSPIRRERPLYLILRRAILLPRAAELSLPVCHLPSQAYAQWPTFVTQLSLFRCILALTVPFAVGFVPFPSELPPDQRSLVFTADSHTTSPDPIYFMPPRG